MHLLFNILHIVLVVFLLISVITIIISAQKENPVELPKIKFKIKKKKNKK